MAKTSSAWVVGFRDLPNLEYFGVSIRVLLLRRKDHLGFEALQLKCGHGGLAGGAAADLRSI